MYIDFHEFGSVYRRIVFHIIFTFTRVFPVTHVVRITFIIHFNDFLWLTLFSFVRRDGSDRTHGTLLYLVDAFGVLLRQVLKPYVRVDPRQMQLQKVFEFERLLAGGTLERPFVVVTFDVHDEISFHVELPSAYVASEGTAARHVSEEVRRQVVSCGESSLACFALVLRFSAVLFHVVRFVSFVREFFVTIVAADQLLALPLKI